MKALDGLRRLPTELEPPRGVRERARQRLLASLATPLGLLPVSGIAPRSSAKVLVSQQIGAKLALVALGSGMVGAMLAFGAPRIGGHGRGSAQPGVTLSLPTEAPSASPSASVSYDVVTADALRVQDLPLIEATPAPAATLARKSVGSPNKNASSLAEERRLLDAAREQLSNGQAGRALELTETHQKRFVPGNLGEEREALAIAALAKLGAHDRASVRAERFKQSYPRSFLTKTVEAAVGAVP